jgi:hypothetical protein
VKELYYFTFGLGVNAPSMSLPAASSITWGFEVWIRLFAQVGGTERETCTSSFCFLYSIKAFSMFENALFI